MRMASQMFPNRFGRWSKETGHAVAIFILSIAFSSSWVISHFSRGPRPSIKGPSGFFESRFSSAFPSISCFPSSRGWVGSFKGGEGTFLEVAEKQDLEIRPTKHSLLRPIQGIGIGLLFGVKLLLVPLGALMISVLRNIVGFPTFRIFMPALMALPFSVFPLIGSRFGGGPSWPWASSWGITAVIGLQKFCDSRSCGRKRDVRTLPISYYRCPIDRYDRFGLLRGGFSDR